MTAYHASGPAVPDGFNWTLWQGPEPDRPYHPSYTFAVYRGWYAYGAGCLGDMGHYSLWQPYRILDLGVPNGSRPGRTTTRGSTRERQHRRPRLAGRFPQRQHHPVAASGDRERPAVDTFWYDGGMKPQTPEELYEDGEDLARRGHADHRGQGKDPVRLPRQAAPPAAEPPAGVRRFGHFPEFDATSAEDEWVNAIKDGRKSKGSFEQVAALAEAVTLAGIALRVPYKRLLWNAPKMEFTNSSLKRTRLYVEASTGLAGRSCSRDGSGRGHSNGTAQRVTVTRDSHLV